MNNNLIYFDHASTSPLSTCVIEAINSKYKNFWGNTSSRYKYGIKCSEELERLRSKIASKFKAHTEDVIFTSGSSESISIVFHKLLENCTPGSLSISAVEHQATIIASNRLRRMGWEIKEWEVQKDGIVKLSNFKDYINYKTKLVSIIWGQSEIGTLQPVQEIGQICSDSNVLFHIDATQVICNGLFNWNKLNCDLLSLSAHKFGGPKGIGMLLTNNKSREFLKNSDISATHEYSIRPGTQSIPLVAGMNKALENVKGNILISDNKIEFDSTKSRLLRDSLLEKFKNINEIEITGSIDYRLSNHLSFILFNKNYEPIKAFNVVNYMSDNNIAISSGSACSNSTTKPSKTLRNIGLEKNKLFSNIRVSFSENNMYKELDKFYNLILDCIDIF